MPTGRESTWWTCWFSPKHHFSSLFIVFGLFLELFLVWGARSARRWHLNPGITAKNNLTYDNFDRINDLAQSDHSPDSYSQISEKSKVLRSLSPPARYGVPPRKVSCPSPQEKNKKVDFIDVQRLVIMTNIFSNVYSIDWRNLRRRRRSPRPQGPNRRFDFYVSPSVFFLISSSRALNQSSDLISPKVQPYSRSRSKVI